jgi:hypothetical protein
MRPSPTWRNACDDPARSSDPAALAPHFAEDEVGELAKALDDYAGA